jgi:serine/threonine protein kinase
MDSQKPLPLEVVESALARYRIHGPIGRGGSSIVYEATDLELGRLVALKIIPARNGVIADSIHTMRECKLMAKLIHRNVVTLHDAGTAPGFTYLIMERMEGDSVAKALMCGTFTLDRAAQIIRQMCAVLDYTHDLGIVHHDIKPGNVLLDRDGNAKLADFGLVCGLSYAAEDTTLADSRRQSGTPQYAAPELADANATADGRADIFSLGIVLYEMVTGIRPAGVFRVPSSYRPDCRAIDWVVAKAMAPLPEERFQTGADFAYALKESLMGKFERIIKIFLKRMRWPMPGDSECP